jgi:hypothetical protein
VTQTEVSVDEVRDYLRELIAAGLVQWLDAARGLDEYGHNERLPIVATLPIMEVTKEEVADLFV